MDRIKELAMPEGTKVTDNNDSFYKRTALEFPNEYELSVISGKHAYGSGDAPYEIAIFTVDNKFCPNLFDEEDHGDDVLGYCTVERVQHYINKISQLDKW